MLLIIRCIISNIIIICFEVGMRIQELFGKRCKELRKNTGLSQEKFALKIDMDRTYYASVESGKRNISIDNIEKIIKGFGVSFKDFFDIGEV